MFELNKKDVEKSKKEFEKLLDGYFSEKRNVSEGKVTKGRVVALEKGFVIVDVGLKAEGKIPIREFTNLDEIVDIKVGDEIEAFVEKIENIRSEAVLSRDRARKEESWIAIEKAYSNKEKVNGIISSRIRGGMAVSLSCGLNAFLPGSQIDCKPIRDINSILNTPLTFEILKIDKRRGNIVVSRRSILEKERVEARDELFSSIKEGAVMTGTCKNITDYGVFVDLGGIDGLLHVTDIAYNRISHPKEALTIGQEVKVKVISIDKENKRFSLGIKQLTQDPWVDIDKKYKVNNKYKGRVTKIVDYGVFIELEPGIEGLAHVSELSWTNKNINPARVLSTSQEVEIMILEIEVPKRRISLGVKQCISNPWEQFKKNYAVNDIIEGEVKSITEFGLFIGLPEDIDGMIHISDLDWLSSGGEKIKEYKKKDKIKAKVTLIDSEKGRVNLSIKHLSLDPMGSFFTEKKKGDKITCTVSQVQKNSIMVRTNESSPEYMIKKIDLSQHKEEQRPERFAKGDHIDVMVTDIDEKTRKLSLSIKALEILEEKEAISQYGSKDSGASLGDILGKALSKVKKINKD